MKDREVVTFHTWKKKKLDRRKTVVAASNAKLLRS